MRWQLRQFPGPSLLSPLLILGVSCNLEKEKIAIMAHAV